MATEPDSINPGNIQDVIGHKFIPDNTEMYVVGRTDGQNPGIFKISVIDMKYGARGTIWNVVGRVLEVFSSHERRWVPLPGFPSIETFSYPQSSFYMHDPTRRSRAATTIASMARRKKATRTRANKQKDATRMRLGLTGKILRSGYHLPVNALRRVEESAFGSSSAVYRQRDLDERNREADVAAAAASARGSDEPSSNKKPGGEIGGGIMRRMKTRRTKNKRTKNKNRNKRTKNKRTKKRTKNRKTRV